MTQIPALFGITHSNRNFADKYYWGKNQFNSAFPVALTCYMRSKEMSLAYVRYRSNEKTEVVDIDVDDVLGSALPNENLYFSFESRFDRFKELVHDDLPPIDLVVCNGARDSQIKPLEIKLTTLPDNTTEALTEDKYGAELVIRSATTRYLALSMVQSLRDNPSGNRLPEVRALFSPVFAKVRNWDSKAEMLQIAPLALQALDRFLNDFKDLQTPLLLQPIWKTLGKTPVLAEHCLDVFVWSDFALTHLFMESARNALGAQSISRQLRAALRLSRFLYESAGGSKVYQAPIYDGMTYDNQNDKEFAISGTKSRPLMACERLVKPSIRKDEIKNILLGGGHKHLSPERRFDAILYFSSDIFEDIK
jgi:HindVP restriction endonuclease